MTNDQIQSLDDCRDTAKNLISLEKEVNELLSKYVPRYLTSQTLFKRTEINKVNHDLRCEVGRAIKASMKRIDEIIECI